jgi:ABC-2 type transport system ATP-binding protein
MPLIATRELTKRFGDRVTALSQLSVDVPPGVVGLVGANGAGKSTLIKILLGLLPATSGSATVLDLDVATEGERIREAVGYMPEHDCLPDNVSASEFLTHMAGVSGLPPSHARSRAADTLRHVGLFEERYRPIGGYSTGMKQRVKLAQALVHDPVLVLLDEPMAGLDPAGRDEMLDLVRKTHRDFGISVVLSSHIMGDVERVCDRILVLESGRVAQEGQVSAFTGDTETLYVEVTARRDEFVVALRERRLAPELEGSSVVIQDVDGDGYDAIRDALVASGAPLRRLAPRRRALTELFQAEPSEQEEEVAS